jgi:predicted transcriptional regulator
MLAANSKLSIHEIAERVGRKRHYVKRIIHGWP